MVGQTNNKKYSVKSFMCRIFFKIIDFFSVFFVFEQDKFFYFMILVVQPNLIPIRCETSKGLLVLLSKQATVLLC